MAVGKVEGFNEGEMKGLVECVGKWGDELKASSITQALR